MSQFLDMQKTFDLQTQNLHIRDMQILASPQRNGAGATPAVGKVNFNLHTANQQELVDSPGIKTAGL
jgi:hypothetical protein